MRALDYNGLLPAISTAASGRLAGSDSIDVVVLSSRSDSKTAAKNRESVFGEKKYVKKSSHRV